MSGGVDNEPDTSLYSGRLLPFQRTILNELVPSPQSNQTGNALLILARGLGLRSIIRTLVSSLSLLPPPFSLDFD